MFHPRIQTPAQWAQQLDFASIERKRGLPAGVLTNLVAQESSGNCDALSPAGAAGLCQFMPKTAAEWKVDVKDPVSSVEGAARYLEYLIDRFGGDPLKGIAAYNCGPGRLAGILREHPMDWRNHLPAETKNYVTKVSFGIGKNYAQRAASGEVVSQADRGAEAARRRGQLASVGARTDLPTENVLGDAFFAIFEMCVKCLKMIGDFISPSPDSVVMGNVRSVQVAGIGTPSASRG